MASAPGASTAAAAGFSADYLADDQGPSVVWASASMCLLTLVVVCLRIAVRMQRGIGVGLDDWLIIAAPPFIFATAAVAIAGVINGGIGQHQDVILAKDPMILTRSLLYLFIAEITYGTALVVVKASILAMYYRIFPTRFMKLAVYTIGSTVILWFVAVELVVVFQCTPVHKSWSPFMTGGTCVDKAKFFIGNAVPNIINDVMILTLPVYEVWKLQVSRSQKNAIAGAFLLGGLVIIFSGIRLKAMFDLLGSADTTYDIAPGWIWTVVEPSIGVLSACLPTLAPLFRPLFKKAWMSKKKKKISGDEENAGDGKVTLVTIGGSSSKDTRQKMSKAKGSGHRSDSFHQLPDDHELELLDHHGQSSGAIELWPKGYGHSAVVSGNCTTGSTSDGSTSSVAVIVKKETDVTWAMASSSASGKALK